MPRSFEVPELLGLPRLSSGFALFSVLSVNFEVFMNSGLFARIVSGLLAGVFSDMDVATLGVRGVENVGDDSGFATPTMGLAE